jgi:MFS family permease
MTNVQDTFKHNRARKNVIVGGMVILVAITLLSCVSSFMIYREGFADMPPLFQHALALFAVIVVEGAFVWLVYGFTRAFSSFWERMISFLAMWGLAAVMLINIITHFMMVKGIELHPFQNAWLAWGAVSVFIGVLVIVLAITLADPVIRLVRLELRFLGKQQETILNARSEGLESERVQQAVAQRAEIESEQLAARILGNANTKYLQPHMIKGFSDGGQSSSYSYSPSTKDYDPKA